METFFLILIVGFAILEIVIIVKFFQIATDLRQIKEKLIVSDKLYFHEIDKLIYLDKKEEAINSLLSTKFDIEQGYLMAGKDYSVEDTLNGINKRLEELK